MFNKDTKSTYAGAMKVLAVLLAFSVVSIAAMRLYTPASNDETTKTVVSNTTSAIADNTDAAMAPLACTNTTSYGSGIAPTAGCVYNVMSTCNFTGEYATASGAVSGSSYVFIADGTGPAYITVRQGTSNGTVLGEGFSPVTVTCTASGNLYAHFNSDAACGTASLGCITSRIGCTSCTGPTQYCAVTSTNTAYGIKNVTTTGGVGNINNTTGSGTYTDYSATMFVSQYEGTPVNFTVTPVSTSSHGYGLWIDWNNNKCFEPGKETIKMSGGYISGNFTGTITIPAGTAAGDYRMRVVNNYLSSAPTACGDLGSSGYGEAEDYTFRVLKAGGGPSPVPCNINYAHSLDNGTGNTQTLLFADDFDVPANTEMTINKVTFRIINDISQATNIRFYTDNAGQPGTLVKGYTNLVPASKTILGTNFGLNWYDMVFNLPTTAVLNTGRYWVAVQTTGGTGSNFWSITYGGIGAPGKYSADNGATWITNTSNFNFAFRLDGQCLDTTPQSGGIECLLVCSNNQTITLAPGACNANVNYLVTTIGPKCTQKTVGPTQAFSQLTSFPTNVDDALDCGLQDAKHSRAYPARTTDFYLNGIDVASWSAGQQRVTIFKYTGALNGSTLDRAQMTQIYQSPFFTVPGGQQKTHYNFAAPVLIPANTKYVVEQEKPAGSNYFIIAGTYTTETANSYITCTQGNTPESYGTLGYSWISLYQVLYGYTEVPGITIKQTKGLPSGSVFPVGKTTNCFKLFDKDNKALDSCCFDIVVQKYPNPTKTLVCNDYLYVSADANCQVSLNADMFLEGGPYKCYDDYIIKVWPFGFEANKYEIKQNTPLNIPLGEHMYEIIDPETGNRCWGSFKVEDKLAPVAQCSCEDKDVLEKVTTWAGQIKETDPLFERCNFLAGYSPMYYTTKKFQVSVDGTYTFNINTNWTTAYYIYESTLFDPANPCNNLIASREVTFIPIPAMNATLQAGKTYVIVATTMWNFDLYNGLYPLDFSFSFSGPGDVLFVTNASDAPECQFKCYDLPTVQAETVSMLYKFPGEQNKAVLTTPPAVTDACGGVDRTFADRYVGAGNCASGKLKRTWTFTDASGNRSTCTQTFTFSPVDIVNDLTPPNPEVHMSCGQETSPADVAAYFDVDSRPQPASATNIGAFADDWAQTPSVVELNEGYAYGYFTWPGKGYDGNLHAQKVDNAVCNVFVSYTDDMLPACGLGCGGNMKVIRTWKLLDWCTGQVFQYIQVIKAVDEKAPTFDVKDLTISVDAWVCSATWVVEKPWELQDNCAKPSELKWGVYAPEGTTLSGKQPDYVINNMPKGRHAITYWAEDCCGNRSEKIAYITVVDATAPVAIAKQNIVMSLTGGNTSGDGVAKLFAWQVDNGSYDQCSRVKLEIRRLDGGACNNIGADGRYNNNSTYNNHNGLTSATPGVTWLHPDDNVNDTDGGEYVKFCCADIAVGEEFGIHQAELRVWDDGNMNGIIGDNNIINGVKDNYNTTWADIRVENKIPPQIVCPADVSVTCDMDINLSIGKDTWVDTVNMTMTGLPKSVGVCNQAKITYKDAGSLDDCRRGTITRTFTATIGSKTATCTQKITISYIQVPFTVTFAQNNGVTKWDQCSFTYADARSNDPRIKKPIVNYGQCDIVGESISIDTFLFEDGACKKWKVTYNYKNWCTGEDKGPFVHYYAFKDEVAPIVVCKDQEFPAVPPAPGNPLGACEGSVILEASASDALICAEESWIKWQVFFDGWANGTVDRLGSSFVNKAWANQWVAIPRLINGQPNPTWVQLQAQHTSVVLEDLVYVTYVKPTKASGESVKLPAFTLPAENIHHKIFWKVTDGCGNVDQCQSTVLVVDKKAPTPYCVHISTAIMQTNPKMVELWAKDFDKGAFDNCTPQNKLYFTFDEIYPVYSKLNVEHYFKAKAGQKEGVDATLAEYNQGRAQKWIPSLRSSGKIWTSAGVTNIKVSVWDEAWNTDFCEVELKIIDNGGGSRPVISGTVATATGDRLNDATVTIDAQVNEYPKSVKTDARGNYSMENPATLDYTVNASKGGDYLNGVTTLDLVIIQRHILGMEILNDNYKIVAADANNDRKVTAQDLTEIRKVILGVSDRFTNESWRFPVAGTAVSTSPIAYTEEIQIDNLTSDVNGNNFVAVKIGDVNGSADLNLGKGNVEARSTENVELNVAEMNVVAGELVEIPVTAGNFNNVAGFQYTMNLKGASYVSIQKGAIEMSGANVGNLGDGVVTMSYAGSEGVTIAAGEVLFTLVIRADKATKMSEILSLNSGVTKAESYNGDLKVGGIELAVRTAEVASIELYQNEPNPFKGQTTVSFMMPEAGAATLTVYDMTGKQVVVRNISAVKGLNSEVFTRDQIGVSGVMYYTLESGDFTATKKMIIVE